MDFGSLSSKSSSMKRKQSSSLLAALGKQPSSGSRPSVPFHSSPTSSYSPNPSTSTFPLSAGSPGGGSDDLFSETTSSTYAESSKRSVSTSTTATANASTPSGSNNVYSAKGSGNGAGSAPVRRPEDVFRLVKERLLSWSYLMQWYQGDAPWLNSVHIPRSAVEASLGAKIEPRSRNEFALGMSLAALLDIPNAADYLRAVLKLLDEWEQWAESGAGKGGVKNLFRGPRQNKRPSGVGAGNAEYTFDGASESYLVLTYLPFQPDFFQVHASTCSIVRDVYKKLLAMVLPARLGRLPVPPLPPNSLLHPSTLIHSAPLDSVSGGGSALYALDPGPSPTSPSASVTYDAFAALVAGQLPHDRTLVGEGQKLTPQIIDLLLKVDTRLKKHFSLLVREGDVLARKVLDDEITALSTSISSGPALSYSQVGSGWGVDGGMSDRQRDYGIA